MCLSIISILQESANKLLSSDMPLYFPCQCSSKGYMAQLMRVYVAAPEGPMQVTLNPQVRPNPPPSPVFYPGNDQPIKLPQGMVIVLRLPYPFIIILEQILKFIFQKNFTFQILPQNLISRLLLVSNHFNKKSKECRFYLFKYYGSSAGSSILPTLVLVFRQVINIFIKSVQKIVRYMVTTCIVLKIINLTSAIS
jgi:hypothetical protein